MKWNYAELSKLAKENGGPEKLVELLIESGKKSVYPWIGVAFAGGVALTVVAQDAIKCLKEKRQTSPLAVEEAKRELIQGIQEYDDLHKEEEENEKN